MPSSSTETTAIGSGGFFVALILTDAQSEDYQIRVRAANASAIGPTFWQESKPARSPR